MSFSAQRRLVLTVFAGLLAIASPHALLAQTPTAPPAATPAPAPTATPAPNAAPAPVTKPSRKSKKKAAATAAASAPSAAAPAGSAVFPGKVDAKYATQSAGEQRMHTCLDQYHANKAGTGNGGMKWIQKGGGYYSECSKKLKG